MTFSIIIPNYNGKHLLEKNLERVLSSVQNTQGFKNIIVIDDGSVDDSFAYLQDIASQHKTIVISQNDRNYGFSTTVNNGVRLAKSEIVVLLNTDVVPEKGFVEPLLSHFSDERTFAVGAMDRSIEGGDVVLRGRGVAHIERGFLVHAAGDLDKSLSQWASGGSSAFRRSIWNKIGGLDEIYNPFYWEDIDLSYKGWKAGYQVYFERKSIVTHEHEKGAIKSKYTPSHVKKIAYRNQFIFAWKNFDESTLIAHLFWLPYHIFKAIKEHDIEFLMAFFLALGKLNQLIALRARESQLWVKHDQECLIKK